MSNAIGLFIFDIGWSELAIIGVVALIAVGPKELPGVLRTLGQVMGKVKRMSAEAQSQFRAALREADVAGFKQQAQDIHSRAATDSVSPAAENNGDRPDAKRDDSGR
jgi:sec-independent protein translocase protein TatB